MPFHTSIQKIHKNLVTEINKPEFTNSFNDDFILPAYVVNEPLQEFRINGTAKRCDGTFVTNGKVIFADFFEIPITDGKIDHHTYDCFSLLDNHTFVVEDYDTQKRSELMIRPVVNNVLEMGEVLLCEDLDHSIQLTIDDEMLNLKPGYMMKSIWMFADIFSNADNVNYLISTAGSDVGSYECFVEIKEEGRPDLILRNTNESTVEFVSFDFDNFYGLSQGNLNGEFTDVMTNKAFDISGTFKVRNIPDFGTY